MAIIIPSKKIYNISNSVVNKNVISAIEYQVVTHKKSKKNQAIYNNSPSTKWKGSFTDIVTSPSSPKLVSTNAFPVRETLSRIISGTEYCAIACFYPLYIDYNIHIDTQITNQHYIDVSDLENNPISLEFRFDVEKRIRNAETRITYNGSAYDWNVYITEDYETNAETQLPPPQIVSNPTIPLEGSVIAKSGGDVPMVGFTLPWKYNKPTNTEYEAVLDAGQTISLNPTFDTNEKGEVTGLNIKVQVLCGATLIEGSGAGTSVYSFGTTVTEYRPNSASIIINGTTYEIVTEQETTVLQSVNIKGEKVSVTGNGLVQNKDYVKSQAMDILYDYENGKETATIRCGVNEYYDENGDLVISSKTAHKMLFEHYDKVVPMVRQSYGVDAPMSLTSENYAKVFEVVGVRVYYDGAVWQELTLKESNESANIQTQLPAPTIRIADDILYIQDGSGLGKSFQIYVDGNAQVITDSKTYPISNIPSITQGSHRIYVVSLGYGNYTSSGASNVVTYMMDIKGGYLTFVGEDGEVTLSASHLWDGQVYISTDAQNWSEWNGKSVSSVDSKIYLRGRNNTTMRGNSISVQAVLRVSGSATKVACYGNIANLLDYTKVSSGKTNEIIMAEACFQYLFLSQTKLTRCPEMPLTTLSKGCYQEMYRGCTQLATLPKLPATTLLDSCYASMFYGCTSIKLATTKNDEYSNEYRIPTEGNISNAPATSRYNMFANTGGTFAPTGNANVLNNILYTANEIV